MATYSGQLVGVGEIVDTALTLNDKVITQVQAQLTETCSKLELKNTEQDPRLKVINVKADVVTGHTTTPQQQKAQHVPELIKVQKGVENLNKEVGTQNFSQQQHTQNYIGVEQQKTQQKQGLNATPQIIETAKREPVTQKCTQDQFRGISMQLEQIQAHQSDGLNAALAFAPNGGIVTQNQAQGKLPEISTTMEHQKIEQDKRLKGIELKTDTATGPSITPQQEKTQHVQELMETQKGIAALDKDACAKKVSQQELTQNSMGMEQQRTPQEQALSGTDEKALTNTFFQQEKTKPENALSVIQSMETDVDIAHVQERKSDVLERREEKQAGWLIWMTGLNDARSNAPILNAVLRTQNQVQRKVVTPVSAEQGPLVQGPLTDRWMKFKLAKTEQDKRLVTAKGNFLTPAIPNKKPVQLAELCSRLELKKAEQEQNLGDRQLIEKHDPKIDRKNEGVVGQRAEIAEEKKAIVAQKDIPVQDEEAAGQREETIRQKTEIAELKRQLAEKERNQLQLTKSNIRQDHEIRKLTATQHQQNQEITELKEEHLQLKVQYNQQSDAMQRMLSMIEELQICLSTPFVTDQTGDQENEDF